MKFEGHLLLQHRVLVPANTWKPGVDAWTVLRVDAGEGYLLSPGPARQLAVGDVIVTNGAGTCELRASQLDKLQLRYFLVKPRLLSGVMSSSQIRALEADGAALAPRLFPQNHAAAREFAGLAEQADGVDAFLLRCRILQLAAKLFAEIAPTTTVPAPAQLSARRRLDQLLQGMAEAEIANHSPRQLAKLCGCSVRHFSRLFRQRLGCSLIARQIEIRLRRAERLLQESDAKVIDVALESGFQHVGLFNAMFKSRYRMTPSAWRRRAQAKTCRPSRRRA